MKNILLILALSVSFSVSATAAKKQQPERGDGGAGPACPAYDCNDERDRGPDGKHQETYEEGDATDDGYVGDERGGDSDGGGMIGEVFSVPMETIKKTYPTTGSDYKEDRGNFIAYITVTQQDFGVDETCTTIIETLVEKATGKVVSKEENEVCSSWPM